MSMSTRFRPMKYAFTGSDERVLMKLVVDADTERVVGVHIVGPEAPEMIQLAAIAVKAGLTKAQWDATCAVHPTMAEELVTLKVEAERRRTSSAQDEALAVFAVTSACESFIVLDTARREPMLARHDQALDPRKLETKARRAHADGLSGRARPDRRRGRAARPAAAGLRRRGPHA